jgi:hypothetical protein
MADILDVTVIIKRNGRDVTGFPYQKRMVVDEIQQFSYEKATGGGYETLPRPKSPRFKPLSLPLINRFLSVSMDSQTPALRSMRADYYSFLIQTWTQALPPTPPSTTAQDPPRL